MKKVIFMLMLFFSLTMSAQEWRGDTYIEAPRSGKYIETPYRYIDEKGVDWGFVHINKENGRCKVTRTKPDGKKSTKYLKEETSRQYCQRMNIPYTYVPKKRR